MTTLKARVNGEWVTVSSGGGAGTDEVWVGPDDPITTKPAIELWYDTDDEPVATDQANFWNSAWGRVGTAVGTASSWTNNTTTLSEVTTTAGAYRAQAQLLTGRRYRIYWQAQITSMNAGDLIVLQPRIGRPSTPTTYPSNFVYRVDVANQAVQCQFEGEYVPTVDGLYEFSMQARLGSGFTGTLATVNMGNSNMLFVVEDVGPVTKAAVNPPAGQPTIATAGNALGVVAVGSMLPISGGAIVAQTVTPVSQPLSVFMAAGRRYRVRGSLRAMSPQPSAAQAYLFVQSAVTAIPGHDTYTFVSNAYDNIHLEFLMNGTGLTERLTLCVQAGLAINVWADQIVSFFYVEDVGPNSVPALPIPQTPPSWTSLAWNSGTWTQLAGVFPPLGYRKLGDMVHVRGACHFLSTGGNPMATLPVGFRPTYNVDFPVNTRDSAPRALYMTVGANGDLAVFGLVGVTDFTFEFQFSTTA